MSSTLRRLIVAGSLIGSAIAAAATMGSGSSPAVATEFRNSQAGIFHAIQSYRTFDSRSGPDGKVVPPSQSNPPDVPLPVYVQFDEDGDAQFPDEAIAVTYNATVTETESAGFIQVDGFPAYGNTSTVNWSEPGQTIANSGVAQLASAFDSSGALGIFVGGAPGAKAHVVIDVTGYYMPAP